jgi:hypothetical protein
MLLNAHDPGNDDSHNGFRELLGQRLQSWGGNGQEPARAGGDVRAHGSGGRRDRRDRRGLHLWQPLGGLRGPVDGPGFVRDANR